MGDSCSSCSSDANKDKEVAYQKSGEDGYQNGQIRMSKNDYLKQTQIQVNNRNSRDAPGLAHFGRGLSSQQTIQSGLTFAEQTKIQQLATIAHKAPKLFLEVLTSGTSIKKGAIMEINCQGAMNSYRKRYDGYTFFGCKQHDMNGDIVNDLIIPTLDENLAQKHIGRHFVIEYNMQHSEYNIRDLGIGFGVFYRLDYQLTLMDNHLLNMGLCFMVVQFIPKIQDLSQSQLFHSANAILKLRLYGGPLEGGEEQFDFGIFLNFYHFLQQSQFDPDQITSIKLGRNGTMNIQINDSLLSKQQFEIRYMKDKGWVLIDGSKGRRSTNGTWLYIGEDMPMYNDMVFKANQTVFQVSIQHQQ